MPHPTTPRPWTKPVRAAATRLGITRNDTQTTPPSVHSAANAPELQFLPSPAHILVLTGPSGGGKTTALRHLAALARRQRRPAFLSTASPLPPHPGPATARLARRRPDWSTDQTLAHLARFGLAEAHCLTIPAHQLSTGQQHRLHLAELVAAALLAQKQQSNRTAEQQMLEHQLTQGEPSSAAPLLSRSAVLFLDEFAAALDDLTAITLAHTLARAARDCNLSIALATHRLCVLPHLRPCTVLECTSAGITRREQQNSRAAEQQMRKSPGSPDAPTSAAPLFSRSAALPPCRIEPAHPRDYHALAHLHYRPGHPANIAGVWRAVIEPSTHSQSPQLAGVLVVSHPTLNAAWREHAWPARYTQGDKRQRAKRLNAELRCIARVIIAPRFRSLGLATQLVRHYLANPLTPHTEALAAMGALSPFFERAGMTPYPLPPSPRDTRLLDLLAHANLDPTWLAEPQHAWQRLIAAIGEPLATRELRHWAQQVPAIRKQPESTWFPHACRTLMSTPIAYAHASSERLTSSRITPSKEPPTQVGGFFERPDTIVRPPTHNPPTRVGGS